MMVSDLSRIRSYGSAVEALKGKTEVKIAHNTTLRQTPCGIAVRYHYTDIVIFHEDGSVTINDGGWATVTTVERLHAMTPDGIRVSREGEWTVYTIRGDIERRLTGPAHIRLASN